MSEVIIDGCNVAECEHLWKDNSVIDLNFCRINFDNNYFSNGIPCCDKCNKHPDCYFKQLQRLKAENEKLKAEIERLRYYKSKIKIQCPNCNNPLVQIGEQFFCNNCHKVFDYN